MFTRTAAANTVALTIPASIIIGTALATQAIVGLRADAARYRALAARPTPTATITRVVAEPVPQPTPTATRTFLAARPVAVGPQPSARPSGGNSAPRALTGSTGARMAAEQAPSSSTRTTAASSSCSGSVLAVRLAALPDCSITVGGSR